jgi:hypothetical protein
MKRYLLVFSLFLALLLPGVASATGGTGFGTGTSAYALGARDVVRVGSNVYACVLNVTLGQVEMWNPVGNSSYDLIHSPSAYTSAGNCACAYDGSRYIDVVYYSSSTVLSFVQFDTTNGTWGTPASIVTITAGGSYYQCAITCDHAGYAHVAYNNYIGAYSRSGVYYINNTGGSGWNSPVNLSTFGGQYFDSFGFDIAIDLTSGTGHRYNTPQVMFIGDNESAWLLVGGNGSANNNNPSSFTSASAEVNTNNVPSNASIIIDSGGESSGFFNSGYSPAGVLGYYLPGSSSWGGGFSGPETVESGSNPNWFAAAVNGTTRYCFMFYSGTGGIYLNSSTSYGTWGTPTKIESASATGMISVAWAYGATYPQGIDFIYTQGTGAGNLYYDNILKPAPANPQPGLW